MRIRKVLVPLIFAAAGFATGWFAHKQRTANQVSEALKQQADMYEKKLKEKNDQLKEADELFQSATYQKALERMDELTRKDWEERTKEWYGALEPGIYTMDEYNQMFHELSTKEAAEAGIDISPPVPTQTERQKGEEGTVSVPWMDWHGDPIDNDDSDDEIYISPEEDESPYADKRPLYIPEDEVGQAPYYQTEFLNMYADGIIADTSLNVLENEEVLDILGEDYKAHFGEYDEGSLFVMNGRTRTYYEVTQDPRTYREACRG